jgi:hypothetical protein
MEHRFPKVIPYVYQMAALIGFGHLLISKIFLTVFDQDMRFWYNFFYLLVSLANIIAVNAYLVFSEKTWNLAKIWSAFVTFPTLLLSAFFVYRFGLLQETFTSLSSMQIVLIVGLAVLGVGIFALVSQKLLKAMARR